jgi:hypothetical protein
MTGNCLIIHNHWESTQKYQVSFHDLINDYIETNVSTYKTVIWAAFKYATYTLPLSSDANIYHCSHFLQCIVTFFKNEYYMLLLELQTLFTTSSVQLQNT